MPLGVDTQTDRHTHTDVRTKAISRNQARAAKYYTILLYILIYIIIYYDTYYYITYSYVLAKISMFLGCLHAPSRLRLAAFSDDYGFVKPMWNPLRILFSMNCTKSLLGWFPNIACQAGAHKGVCTMLAVRGTALYM